MTKRAVFLLVLFLAGISAAGSLSYRVYQNSQESHRQRLVLEKKRQAWEQLRKSLWGEIRDFHGEAGVLIEDLGTGWKLGYRYQQRFPAASLVKVPVMAACFEAAQQGKLDLSEQLVLKRSDKVGGSGVLRGKSPGAALTIRELIELMVTESDNTAANMLISRIGFNTLNHSFERQGLGGTVLVRKMMDFSNRRNGVENYTTAEDVASILRRLYYFQVVNPLVSSKCLELLMQQKINDRIPAGLPPEIIVAHKTGLENGVCHDSGIVFTGNGNYLITVLTRHNGKTAQPAKKFIARLSSLTYRYMTES